VNQKTILQVLSAGIKVSDSFIKKKIKIQESIGWLFVTIFLLVHSILFKE